MMDLSKDLRGQIMRCWMSFLFVFILIVTSSIPLGARGRNLHPSSPLTLSAFLQLEDSQEEQQSSSSPKEDLSYKSNSSVSSRSTTTPNIHLSISSKFSSSSDHSSSSSPPPLLINNSGAHFSKVSSLTKTVVPLGVVTSHTNSTVNDVKILSKTVSGAPGATQSDKLMSSSIDSSKSGENDGVITTFTITNIKEEDDEKGRESTRSATTMKTLEGRMSIGDGKVVTEKTPLGGDQKQATTNLEHHPPLPSPAPLQTNRTSNRTGDVALRGKCNSTEQCRGEYTECRVQICKCALGFLPRVDNGELCGEAIAHHVQVPQADPTMIGVVIGLALMSVTLCVVLRLFAKARFRENRTIFNTPNPRLMNVSLLKGSKTLLRGNSAGQRSRRGSQASINSESAGGEGGGNGSSLQPHPSNNGHQSRPRPHRQLSTDTTNTADSSTPSSARPMSSINKVKQFRQDSVASNV